MFGAMIAATLGWREIGFLVPDGSTRAVGHGTGLSIKNDGFVDAYYDDGRAKDYYSDVEVIKDGQTVKAGRLRVNSPLSTAVSRCIKRRTGRRRSFSSRTRRRARSSGTTACRSSSPMTATFARQFVDAAGEFEPTGVQRFDDLGVTLADRRLCWLAGR